MKVHCYDRQKDLSISKRPLSSLIEVVLLSQGIETDEVHVHFVTTRRISELHEQYFDDPTTTDCITFPIDPQGEHSPRVLGEIFICPQTAIDYAKKHRGDPYRETLLYLVHGLLHCLGFDDLNPQDRKKMRQAEAKAMKALDQANLSLHATTAQKNK